MKIQESLECIHRTWLNRISRSLARGEDLRENFEGLLEQFFNRLIQSIDTGDPSWMDELLVEWVQARTQTDLEDRETSLLLILNQIHQITFETARDNLSESDALALMETILPVFLHSFDYASHLEMERNIDHISQKLEEAHNNLEKLDRSKSDFIAIAAHELKTPLTLIEGYVAMLREALLIRNDPTQTDLLLNGVNNGTIRLRQIIDDMIDVSLIDNNLLSLNFQPLWMNRLLHVLKDEFMPVIQERGLKFELLDFPGCDELSFGDNERLYQAFRNLYSNAIKFTPDGGKIIVDGRLLPGFIEVTVADTGIGIDPNDHNMIFEKFGRLGNVSLHSSGKTKFKGGGPGLGLSITRGIIEAHGGSIWVESSGYNEKKCPGSTFHVLLPILKSPPDPKIAKLFFPIVDEGKTVVG
jgi:signal transduction histidine kinase